MSGTFSFPMRLEVVLLNEWEVRSLKGQDEVNSGAILFCLLACLLFRPLPPRARFREEHKNKIEA